MDINLKHLISGGVLALLLTACGGGGGGSDGASTGGGGGETPSNRELPEEMADVVDENNAFTNEFCSDASEGSTGTPLDPALCLEDSEENGGAPSLDGVVAQFCPTAAESFDAEGLFDPEAFIGGFDDPMGFVTDGPLSFPVACLQESATNLDGLGDLVGGSNPITDQLCPIAAGSGEFDPASCFAEITDGTGGGGLPEFPGGDGATDIPGADQFCPDTAADGVGPETALNCLDEASRVYIALTDMLTSPNPLTEAVCPVETATGRVDPVVCFEEALSGGGGGGLPGLGDLPGLPGDGGEMPEIPGLDSFCPDALNGEIGPTTPIDCLTEAGDSLGGLQDLLGGLGGSNPLTEALCPVASEAESLDPAACLTEGLGSLPGAPGGGDGGVPELPGLDQLCPALGEDDVSPTAPLDCLMDLGDNLGGLGDMLGDLGGSNPLTEQFCPDASADESFDPQACIGEALGGLPGAPGDGGDGGTPELPGADMLLDQICPDTGAGEVGPTTPIECLSEAGENLGGLQDLLGGLGGANPLTEALCPAASAEDSLDPAACFTEALDTLPGAPGGDGGVPEIPGLSDGLTQICPVASENIGPTTPLECLVEAGGNFDQITELLGGSNPLTEALCPANADDPVACFMEALETLPVAPGEGGSLPGLDGGLEQICPVAGENIGPTTPIECLVEAGGNLEQLQDLLGGGLGEGEGGDPLTSSLCPEASAGGLSPTLPFECLLEAGTELPTLLTDLLGGLAP